MWTHAASVRAALGGRWSEIGGAPLLEAEEHVAIGEHLRRGSLWVQPSEIAALNSIGVGYLGAGSIFEVLTCGSEMLVRPDSSARCVGGRVLRGVAGCTLDALGAPWRVSDLWLVVLELAGSSVELRRCTPTEARERQPWVPASLLRGRCA